VKIHFAVRENTPASALLEPLAKAYGQVPLEKAELVVTVGGDGAVLHALHSVLPFALPVYGMNKGSFGFLTNACTIDHLLERLQEAHRLSIFPLVMEATTMTGETHRRLAFNEVYLLRTSRLTARIAVSTNGTLRLPMLVGDGVLVATPLGSTAYNSSARGPILPLDANMLALTPINAFRPRNWRGALISSRTHLEFSVLGGQERPTKAVADFSEISEVSHVAVSLDSQNPAVLLFDKEAPLEDRILGEQFSL
jgi:NAD+ kinase